MTRRFEGKRALVSGAAGGRHGRPPGPEGAAVVGVDLRARTAWRKPGRQRPGVGGPQRSPQPSRKPAGSTSWSTWPASTSSGASRDLDVATWERHLGVNLTGPMLMSHAALPHLRQSKGNIVTISSIAGLRAQPYQAAYCASKAGVIMLMKSLALELYADGIRVNTVCPGGVETDLPMTAAASAGLDSDLDWGLLTETAGGRSLHAAARHL